MMLVTGTRSIIADYWDRGFCTESANTKQFSGASFKLHDRPHGIGLFQYDILQSCLSGESSVFTGIQRIHCND